MNTLSSLRTIAYLEGLLASPVQQRSVIRQDLMELRERYADARRTEILPHADGSFDDEDLVAKEDVLISVTQRSYIKRVPWTVYKAQNRGGRGVLGMATNDEDEIKLLVSANSHDMLLFFTDHGKVYQEKVYQIPDAGRTARGALLAGILAIAPEERVTCHSQRTGVRGCPLCGDDHPASPSASQSESLRRSAPAA